MCRPNPLHPIPAHAFCRSCRLNRIKALLAWSLQRPCPGDPGSRTLFQNIKDMVAEATTPSLPPQKLPIQWRFNWTPKVYSPHEPGKISHVISNAYKSAAAVNTGSPDEKFALDALGGLAGLVEALARQQSHINAPTASGSGTLSLAPSRTSPRHRQQFHRRRGRSRSLPFSMTRMIWINVSAPTSLSPAACIMLFSKPRARLRHGPDLHQKPKAVELCPVFR